MDFLKKYYLEVITKRYFQLSGRASRKEFWSFVLISFVVSFVLGAIGSAVGLVHVIQSDLMSSMASMSGNADAVAGFPINILQFIYSLAVLLPSFSLTVRRLHDIGKSGWWQLILFVPIVGVIALLIFMVLQSQGGENRYGAEPV